MFRSIGGAVLACACLALLAGCTNKGDIFRTTSLDAGHSLVTDARQRVVTNVAVTHDQDWRGHVTSNRVVCAEPSPDVAVALASSTQLGASFGYQAATGSGAFSKNQAEGLAQIAERTATIQLLRDGLYRACEAYANGALSSTEYAMVLSRLDEAVISLRSIEVAGGAFGAAGAAIAASTEGTAEAASAVSLPGADGGAGAAAAPAEPAAPSGGGGAGASTNVNLTGSGTTTVTPGGAISNEIVATTAPEITAIHAKYMDDLNMDSLIAVCLHVLSGPQTGKTILFDQCARAIQSATQAVVQGTQTKLELLGAGAAAEKRAAAAMAEAQAAKTKLMSQRCSAVFADSTKKAGDPEFDACIAFLKS
jgi:hypothetical protein